MYMFSNAVTVLCEIKNEACNLLDECVNWFNDLISDFFINFMVYYF